MRQPHKKHVPLWVFILLAAAMFCLGMCWGQFHVSLRDLLKVLASCITNVPVTWSKNTENVVLAIRLPRMCAAFLVGAGLAVSGAAYQGIFQNMLVSPDLLGVSAGACVGASIAILTGGNSMQIQLFALIGGFAAVALTNMLPKLLSNRSNLMLVLSGIIVSGFFTSVQGLLKYVADQDTQLAQITFWTMGSLSKIISASVAPVAPAMLISMLVLVVLRWRLNLLSLGETEAKTLGVNVRVLRGVTVLCSTVLTACSICLGGTIGWVGLVIPHLGRMLVGSDNKRLIPTSIFLGAAFMMLIDSISRNLSAAEVPLSILTGFIGAPLYTWLLLKQRAKL